MSWLKFCLHACSHLEQAVAASCPLAIRVLPMVLLGPVPTDVPQVAREVSAQVMCDVAPAGLCWWVPKKKGVWWAGAPCTWWKAAAIMGWCLRCCSCRRWCQRKGGHRSLFQPDGGVVGTCDVATASVGVLVLQLSAESVFHVTIIGSLGARRLCAGVDWCACRDWHMCGGTAEMSEVNQAAIS
jgi:hypothetical protein